MFGVIAPTVRAGIKALCKSGVLKEYGIERLIRLSDRSSIEVYDLETIAALCFPTAGKRSSHSRLQRRSKHGAFRRPPRAKKPLKTETTAPPSPTDRKGEIIRWGLV